MNLDQTLIALCEKHDLTSVSLHASRGTYRNDFYCFAHWAGQGCAAHERGASITEALTKTIAAANEARVQQVEVPALELDEVPA